MWTCPPKAKPRRVDVTLVQAKAPAESSLKAWEISLKLYRFLLRPVSPIHRVLVWAIHRRLIRFVYSILIPFVGPPSPPACVFFTSLTHHRSKWVNSRSNEYIYIDYNVKIRQIDKIDKSILMAIQQRKIYIFHWAPGWSSVFPMLSCFDVSSDCAPDFFQLNSSLICVSILKKRDTAAATALLHNR